MIRLYMVVEGPIELAFVKGTLGPYLDARGVFTFPMAVTTSRDRRTGKKFVGGGHWMHWRNDLQRLMAQHRGPDVYLTTLFDLYGLPRDFPGLQEAVAIDDTTVRAERLEQAMMAEVSDARLIPYLQRHEFEAFVLAGLDSLEQLLDTPDDLKGLQMLRTSIAHLAPEDVNDGRDSAPSKRLLEHIPGYDKTLYGPLVAGTVGIDALRSVCPRFHAWIAKLERLNQNPPP